MLMSVLTVTGTIMVSEGYLVIRRTIVVIREENDSRKTNLSIIKNAL